MDFYRRHQIQENLRRIAATHVAAMRALEETSAMLDAEFQVVTASNQRQVYASQSKSAANRPFVNRPLLSVMYRGKSCFLGNTLPLRLIERLLRPQSIPQPRAIAGGRVERGAKPRGRPERCQGTASKAPRSRYDQIGGGNRRPCGGSLRVVPAEWFLTHPTEIPQRFIAHSHRPPAQSMCMATTVQAGSAFSATPRRISTMSNPLDSHRVPAAQYVRMSTEHQQYSTSNQGDVICEYAERRGYTIVRTYADDGKSGLNVAGRGELRRLIADVQSGNPGFSAILVFDVSRWGRFQDADESAYYEYLCKQAGIDVHYCAEQFENDGGPTSTIIKSVKRAMAGEYSRELSSKVFKGQCRLIELGYRQGGMAGYGLRRMLINQAGVPKGALARGECKSLQTDRVILVPGPEEEIRVVRRIYDEFTKKAKREAEIAADLNAQGIVTDLGRCWTRGTVHQVLTNEKYIGNNVFNRTSFKLKKKHVCNTPDMWVRADGVFEGMCRARRSTRPKESSKNGLAASRTRICWTDSSSSSTATHFCRAI